MDKKDFVCVRGSGSRSGHRGTGTSSPLSTFIHSPDCRVLLLPLKLGAEGLDLVCANHIYLLEPLMNKSMELQVRFRSRASSKQ